MARIYADFNDPSDQAEVAAIQSKMQIVGLSDWGVTGVRKIHPGLRTRLFPMSAI
jgi:hypothetical protein